MFRNLYLDFERRPTNAKLKIGDKVRIHKKKGLFHKGFTPNGQRRFSISKTQRTIPIASEIT